MFGRASIRRGLLCAVAVVSVGAFAPPAVHAQGFISPSIGYNFGGNAGCRSATDCEDKNWNWGGSIGSLGSLFGFEAELTYEGDFTGDRPDHRTTVTTGMANFMLAPKISIVQPYGLIGVGLIKTKVEDKILNVSDSENQIGWTIGGGVVIYLQQHVGVKGDIRYYHSFESLDLLGFDVLRGNKIDFGRAGLGLVFKF